MNLYRKLIPGNVFVNEATSGVFIYVAASSDPDPPNYELVTPAIEGWDLYGKRSELTTAEIRDELKALYLGWGSHSASEKDVFARWFIADASDRDTLYTTAQQEVFAKLLCIDMTDTQTVFNLDSESNSMAVGNSNESDAIQYNIKEAGKWKPNSIPLGSVLTSGATYFINSGAGIYLSFSGTSDDSAYFNDSLEQPASPPYDGADLAIKLHCRLSSNGGVGDTVGILLDYAIIKDGDNSSTIVTNVPQQNIDVSSELQDIDFNVKLGTMTGVDGADTVMVTITRNGTGPSADTYSGNFEVLGLEWVKL